MDEGKILSHDLLQKSRLFIFFLKIENQNVADYFDQLISPISRSKLLNKNTNKSFLFSSEHPNIINQSKKNMILDNRKIYNLGLFVWFLID